MDGNDESAIAKAVSGILGIRHVDFVLKPEHFIDYALTAVQHSEGQDLFVQGYLLYIAEQLQREYEIDSIMDAMEVGVSLGGDYLRDEYRSIDHRSLKEYLYRKFYIHKDATADIFVDSNTDEILYEVIEEAISDLSDIPSTYDKMDVLYVENYTREAMRLRHRLMRKRVNVIPMTASNEYLELVTSLQGCHKQERRFQLALLHSIDPKLLDIPYHSTMMPLRMGREEWQKGRERIDQEELLALAVWRDHKKIVPFNHYFTNFSEWLRSDPNMVGFMKDLLLANRCILTQGIIRSNWMAKIVSEHVNGIRDHRSTIQYLMSCEYYLRTQV
jgi:hypothetical protein